MQKTDLAVLLRASKGDVHRVAVHIFQQQRWDQDDHDLLYEHIEALTQDELMEWLACSPPRPRPIVDALLAKLPERSGLGWLFPPACLREWAARLEPDALDDLAERLRPRLDPGHWWHIARHLKGMSPFFHGVLSSQEDCDIAAWLFPYRRDDMACRRALCAAAASGGMQITSPEVLNKIGRDPGFHGSAQEDNAGTEEGEEDEGVGLLPVALVDAASPQVARKIRAQASVVAWLESRQMLAILSPEDALPAEVWFGAAGGLDTLRPNAGRYLLTLALHWPGDAAARARARAWYVRQFLGAARRGVRWSDLVQELVGPYSRLRFDGLFTGHAQEDRALAADLLDEIAWASLGEPVVAPWLGPSVYTAFQRGEPDAWERALRFLDRCLADPGLLQADPDEARRLLAACLSLDNHGLYRLSAGEVIDWILLRAPLPEGADERFEERLFSYHERIMPHITDEFARTDLLGLHAQFARRAQFPITRARANRLLAMALENERLMPVLLGSKLGEVAAAADPLPPEHLPALEAFLLPDYRAFARDAAAAYLRLGGAAAEVRLRAWVWAPLQGQHEDASEDASWSRAPENRILEVLWRAQVDPDLLLTEDLKQELAVHSRHLPVLSAVTLHEAAPWLLDEATLVAIAEARAEDPGEPWCRWSGVDVPACLAPAVRRRARLVAGEQEFLALARWLAGHGERPADLVSLALDRIQQRPPTDNTMEELMGWLGTVLASRRLWEQHGPRVMEVLVQQKAWMAIYKLMRDSFRRPDPARSEPVPRAKLLGAMQEALAVVLLRRVKAEIQASNAEAASASLQALVALHPPSRLSLKLHELRRLPSPSSEVSELLELNLRLLRNGTTRDATLSDVDTALSLLAETSAA